jgi:hypothetical protein
MTPIDTYDGLDEIYRLRLEAFVALLNRELQMAEGYPDVQVRLRAQQQRARQALERLAARNQPTES